MFQEGYKSNFYLTEKEIIPGSEIGVQGFVTKAHIQVIIPWWSFKDVKCWNVFCCPGDGQKQLNELSLDTPITSPAFRYIFHLYRPINRISSADTAASSETSQSENNELPFLDGFTYERHFECYENRNGNTTTQKQWHELKFKSRKTVPHVGRQIKEQQTDLRPGLE